MIRYLLLLFFFANQLCGALALEVKSGYFFFTDKELRRVFDKGGFDIQLSGTLPLWKWINLYTSVEYLQKEGNSSVCRQRTEIWQIPVTVGLQASMQMSNIIQSYLTIGSRYFYVHMHNDSPFVDRNLHRNGVGGFIGTGLIISRCNCFFIDLFGEYSYEKTRFHPRSNVYTRNIQVGGFVFGGGLGYAF